MKIKKILSENNRKPYNEALKADSSLQQAAHRMSEKGVGAMLVCDKDDPQKYVGIISERDILKRCGAGDKLDQVKIESVMSRDLFMVKEDDDVEFAMTNMDRLHIRHAPVIDSGSKIIDLISIRDILRSRIEECKITIEHLSDFSRGTRKNEVY